MSNELKYTYAAAVTLEDNGATLVASAMGVADAAILSAGNHSDYPMGDFVLKCSFGTADQNGSGHRLLVAGAKGAIFAAPARDSARHWIAARGGRRGALDEVEKAVGVD